MATDVGSYASGPTPEAVGMMGVPISIQEQNFYADATSKLLAGEACKICIAYEGMEKSLPVEKIIMAGDPVHQDLLGHFISHGETAHYLDLDLAKKQFSYWAAVLVHESSTRL